MLSFLEEFLDSVILKTHTKYRHLSYHKSTCLGEFVEWNTQISEQVQRGTVGILTFWRRIFFFKF